MGVSAPVVRCCAGEQRWAPHVHNVAAPAALAPTVTASAPGHVAAIAPPAQQPVQHAQRRGLLAQ